MTLWHRVFSDQQIAQSMVCDQAFSGLKQIISERKRNVDRQALFPAHIVTGNIRRNYQGKHKSNLHLDFVKYCPISSLKAAGTTICLTNQNIDTRPCNKFRAALCG